MSDGRSVFERSGERTNAPRLQSRDFATDRDTLIPARADASNGLGSNAPCVAVRSADRSRTDHRGDGRNGGQAMSRSYTISAIGPNGSIVVKGQTARALEALVKAREKGVTALEVSCWAYRFAAYCHDLRHKHGLAIDTIREEHEGGWHGRHVMRSTIEIVAVSGDG